MRPGRTSTSLLRSESPPGLIASSSEQHQDKRVTLLLLLLLLPHLASRLDRGESVRGGEQHHGVGPQARLRSLPGLYQTRRVDRRGVARSDDERQRRLCDTLNYRLYMSVNLISESPRPGLDDYPSYQAGGRWYDGTVVVLSWRPPRPARPGRAGLVPAGPGEKGAGRYKRKE